MQYCLKDFISRGFGKSPVYFGLRQPIRGKACSIELANEWALRSVLVADLKLSTFPFYWVHLPALQSLSQNPCNHSAVSVFISKNNEISLSLVVDRINIAGQ